MRITFGLINTSSARDFGIDLVKMPETGKNVRRGSTGTLDADTERGDFGRMKLREKREEPCSYRVFWAFKNTSHGDGF